MILNSKTADSRGLTVFTLSKIEKVWVRGIEIMILNSKTADSRGLTVFTLSKIEKVTD